MRILKWASGFVLLLSACSSAMREDRRSGRLNGTMFSALIFSKTTGFRHDSIPNGIAAITELGQANGFAVDATEDSSLFTDDYLAQYQVVIFLCTTGTVLDDQQKAAFERYIQRGNGYVGIHSAADTEYDWPFYGQLMGAYFRSHPEIQPASLVIEDFVHSSTSSLPNPWARTDEWYNFQTNPRGSVHVLMSIDESSYRGGDMGDHPMAWCHDVDGGGRAWYTELGHTWDSYDEPEFRQHLLGGISTAAGALPADCSVTP